MNNCFKYGLMSLLILLLHCAITQEVQETRTTSSATEQAACFTTSDSYIPFPRSPFLFYNSPCECRHADSSPLPGSKSIIRLTARYRTHKQLSAIPPTEENLLFFHTSSRPVEYYVFGLRKIIV